MIMTSISLQNFDASTPGFPPVMVLTTKLLTQNSSNPDPPVSLEDKSGQFVIRANHMTALLKSIPGYLHGGIND